MTEYAHFTDSTDILSPAQLARVARSFGDPNRWALQYYDGAIGRWFDIGETHESELQAQLAETAYLSEHAERG